MMMLLLFETHVSFVLLVAVFRGDVSKSFLRWERQAQPTTGTTPAFLI